MMDSASADPELRQWLRWASESGKVPSYVRTVAEAALLACVPDYGLLRPVLLKLKRRHPEPCGERPMRVGDAIPHWLSQTGRECAQWAHSCAVRDRQPEGMRGLGCGPGDSPAHAAAPPAMPRPAMASARRIVLPSKRFRLEEINMPEELASALAGQAVDIEVLPEVPTRTRLLDLDDLPD